MFQAYNLVPVLTAAENVEFVLELPGHGGERTGGRARNRCSPSSGSRSSADRRPNELSGGQQQRWRSHARCRPAPLVLADEPTANLDSENAEILMRLMRRLRDEHGMTFVFSTHDPRVQVHADAHRLAA